MFRFERQSYLNSWCTYLYTPIPPPSFPSSSPIYLPQSDLSSVLLFLPLLFHLNLPLIHSILVGIWISLFIFQQYPIFPIM